jgi:hypothetical protein
MKVSIKSFDVNMDVGTSDSFLSMCSLARCVTAY